MKKTLKKITVATTIVLMSSMTHANDFLGQYNTSCTIYDLHAKASKVLRPVKSDHAISITNTSNGTQTYNIKYQNYILYSGTFYNLNAEYTYDVTLNQGETTNLNAPISKDANFSMKSTYPLLCKTTITLNGKEVSSVQSRNYAYIE